MNRKIESLNHYNRVRDSRRKVQGSEAEALRKAVGIPSDGPGNIQDISLYENYLKVKIVVLSSRIGNRRVYEASPLYEKQFLCIILILVMEVILIP